jgi:hypothetical protein
MAKISAAVQARLDVQDALIASYERELSALRTRVEQLEISNSTRYVGSVRRTQSQADRDAIREAAMALAQRLGRSVTRDEVIASMRN